MTELSCLSSGDAAEAVTSRRVVRPVQAISTAMRAVPDSDVLRAVLCRDPQALVYRITVLRRDGRMMRVTVDAPSGNVLVVH
ncbi:PepSY domain-containing protein [Enterovirga sp.]|uniref:PepSY domain-containing protein n=1 Tax=Enterovirga sp. TaxID=2026350 RepID=UPI002609F16A|nr:PepSY domain-containing protein [Enterovirga sp.]